MSQIRQKTTSSKGKKSKNSLFDKLKSHRKTRKYERIVPRRKKSNLSFPVPSFGTIAIIMGTVVIGLAALNWENFNFEITEIYSFQPANNPEAAEERIIQYAATGIPTIWNQQAEAQSESGQAVAPVNTEIENYHGSLVTFEWKQYRVQRGDSVSLIAQRNGVSVGAIIASNEIRNARRLQEGTVLRIPNIDGIPYQVQRGDNLSRIAASFNVPLEVILDVNDIRSDNIRAGETLFIPGARMNDIDLRLSLGELFIFPLQTRRHVTSYFGMRKDPISGVLQFHDGVDFRANTGTTVMAAMEGTVSVVSENWLYGKYIIISHPNGYKTLYGHLNSFNVRQGDRVARGRKIAESGNTGYSTGPHLHFGVYDRNNRLLNPLDLIN